MLKVTADIALTVTGPLLTQSSQPGAWGLDLVAARNAAGQYYLPGTLLVGKLRQAWDELQDALYQAGSNNHWFKPQRHQWLGECHEDGFPKAKRLVFSDLVWQGQLASDTLHRIKIDPERSAVAKNQLVLIENPFAVGKDFLFSGTLHFFASGQSEADAILRHVRAGLRWTPQLGAMRSIGFGRIKRVDCKPTFTVLPEPVQCHPPVAEKITLLVRPLHPFCMTGKPVTNNLFESQEFIPGGALLGAIATTWNHLCGASHGRLDEVQDPSRALLKTHFSQLRITHALPLSCTGQRPQTPPLSLVKLPDDKRLYDVALLDGPCLINGKAPAFAVDWKDGNSEEFGWITVTKELRTRTRIDPNTRRAAENDLFSYEQVVPDGLTWQAELDLSRVDAENRNAVYAQFQSLLSGGIIGLGKTKTPASVCFQPEQPVQALFKSDSAPLHGGLWIVTLQTDALLGAPQNLDESSGQAELEKMYTLAWQELSGHKLLLRRYFARQRLSGGKYRQAIFQTGQSAYHPWLLTEAGSVFVLQIADGAESEQGEALIQDWLQHGLPLTGAALDYYGIPENIAEQWQSCPFVPQNGYGEIAVNLALHTDLKPDNIQPIPVIGDTKENRHGDK